MHKKLISAVLSAALVFACFASGGFVFASGEDLTAQENAGGKSAKEQSAADTKTETTDNSRAVVEQNRTKHNDMLNEELSEEYALSRYSEERVALSPDIEDTKYEEAAEVLGALGIMVGDAEDGMFRPNDSILRSEMAKVSVYTAGYEDVAKGLTGPTRFPDVVSNHWANGAINVADQQGMVIGDDVGTFRPDDDVLFQEAVTIMVRTLGYEPKAAASGGYPTGYMVTASSIQLLKGISANGAEPAKRGDIAQLVFNTLTVNMMEQKGYGSNITYEETDKTLLFDRLNVEKGYGQIKSTSETGLDGGAVSDGKIKINDSIFTEGHTTAKEHLGYNVVYYARIDTNSDEKTLILIRPQDNKNKTLKIDAENLSEVKGEADKDKTVIYWENKSANTTKTATVVANPVYILNGKYESTVAPERIKTETGNIILLDTDVNGIYDIVFINELKNIVVSTVSTVTGRITDKYNGGSILLDPEDDSIDYSIILDGYSYELKDLKEWDVISYTTSEDKTLIKAYVSRESILGTVTQITDDGIKFDSADGVYEIAKSYPNEINIRDKGRFYLDIEGKIAAFDENATADENNAGRGDYAYLVNAGITGTIDKTAQFKIFNTAGETVVLNGADKMRLGSTYGLTPEKMISELGKDGNVTPQLITFETNSSGKVTGIDLAVDVTETGAPNTTKFSKNVAAESQVYKSASKKIGNVTVGENTVIFDIPAEAEKDTSKYSVRGMSALSNDTPYDIIVYDLQEDYTAKVVIITNTQGITNPESPLVVVSQIASGQNGDYEDIDIVTGYENGKEVELKSTDKTVFVKGTNRLEAGDIFQYNTNTKGEVDSITLLFDVSKKTTEFSKEVSTDLKLAYGRVTKRFANSVNLDVNGEVKNYSTDGATVYSFNSGKKNNKVTVVSPADIELYEEGNEVYLFIKLYKDEVREMVIVR